MFDKKQKFCARCDSEFSGAGYFCPNCVKGVPFEAAGDNAKAPKKKRFSSTKVIAIIVIITVIAPVVMLAMLARHSNPNAAIHARNSDAARIAHYLNIYEAAAIYEPVDEGTRESAETVAEILMNGGTHSFYYSGSLVASSTDPSYWGRDGRRPVVIRNDEGKWEAVYEPTEYVGRP